VVIDCSRADTNLCHHAARTLLAGASVLRMTL
jgi:hypothetical protein